MATPFAQATCDLCGAPGRFYGRGRKCDLLRCPRCGLLWTHPLHRFEAALPEGSFCWAEEVYESNAAFHRERFRGLSRTLLRVGRIAEPGSIRALEVGSGLGFFLDACEELGIHAEGCDLSERAVQYANRRAPRARVGTLDGHYGSDSFDLLCAFNLIEHLTHPGEFITEARRVLRVGGLLALETPVQESLFHVAGRLAYWLSRGRLRFFGMTPDGHIYKFSKRTFRVVGERFGFSIVYQRNIESPFKEIWAKSGIAKIEHRRLYRCALPVAWFLARASGLGNRLFIVLRKN